MSLSSARRTVIVALSLTLGFSGTGAADEKSEVLYTSPNGAFRIESSPAEGPGTEEATGDVWVVSTKDPTAAREVTETVRRFADRRRISLFT